MGGTYKTLQKTARSEVDKMILTDAPVLFPSRQLALAAFRNSNALHKVINFDSYLRSIFSRENSMHTMSEFSESLNAIDSLVIVSHSNILRKYKSSSKEEREHLDAKLKSCWGLSSHDEYFLYPYIEFICWFYSTHPQKEKKDIFYRENCVI
ncbi:cyclin-H1-1-like [Glycine soja]|uniref:cyclin-H1-1-like n=1 Tax=Glycine soja TaxID=3848 RepID=UPI00103F6A45|nr:cyclin-H1-1-like [Glycine soja]